MSIKIHPQVAPTQCSFPQDKGWNNKKIKPLEFILWVLIMSTAYAADMFEKFFRKLRSR